MAFMLFDPNPGGKVSLLFHCHLTERLVNFALVFLYSANGKSPFNSALCLCSLFCCFGLLYSCQAKVSKTAMTESARNQSKTAFSAG